MPEPAIAPPQSTDIPALGQIVDATGLFPSDLLPALLAPALAGETTEFWLTATLAGEPVGFSYTVPEMLANGAWNMTAIAVMPDRQGQGIGTALLSAVTSELQSKQQRLLLVDTSSAEDFVQTRAFYLKNGFEEEARIRDYWAEGDDKVVFRKPL